MSDANELVKLIKLAATEAVGAEKPMNVCYGVVVAIEPLQIQVEQKMTLGEAQLILCRTVTEHDETIVIDDDVKTITLQNGLLEGDAVLLLRWQGGQKYVVLDRIG